MIGDEGQLDFGFGAHEHPRPGPPAHPLATRVRFGTSSFSWEDWVGPFYPPGTKPGDFLRYYATQFTTVEVDATYYAIPNERMVDGWAAKTPDNFQLAAKFPRSIVHAGATAKPDPAKLLDPKATEADRDEFLSVMSRLGAKLGPLVLQMPFLARTAFATAEPFLEKLDTFLGLLPPEHQYAVEVRNPDWVAPPLADVCRRHHAALVLVDQQWMPHGDRIERRMDPVTADFSYIRLLGDRKRIEAITTTWEKEVIDHSRSLERWVELLVRLAERGVLTSVFVNNHYAGHAPATVRKLQELFLARVTEHS